MVPASTIATYGTAHIGEYCIATFFMPLVILRSPSTCSVQLEYGMRSPGSGLVMPRSIRCSNPRGSPCAGIK